LRHIVRGDNKEVSYSRLSHLLGMAGLNEIFDFVQVRNNKRSIFGTRNIGKHFLQRLFALMRILFARDQLFSCAKTNIALIRMH
jgi:hypothetical protein